MLIILLGARPAQPPHLHTSAGASPAEPVTSKPGSQALSNFTAPRHDSGIRPDERAPAMSPEYHINLFWSEPDSAWVADVPDLQLCSAFGDTPAEALSEVEQPIEAWVAAAREDALPIPEPATARRGVASA